MQDIAEYRKSKEKSVVMASRNFVNCIRSHYTMILKSKDRGKDVEKNMKPHQYAEENVDNTEDIDIDGETEQPEGSESSSDEESDFSSEEEEEGQRERSVFSYIVIY